MSIMAITDESGVLRESRSGVYPDYHIGNAWGLPIAIGTRDPSTWAFQLTPFGAVNFTSRGYTFHVRETCFLKENISRTTPPCGEHLIQYSLINMQALSIAEGNARMGVYPACGNPVIGRVLSPDNFVQDATGTQNFNRYTYCLNNPLKYTDPDGNIIVAAIVTAAIIGGAMGAYSGGRIANNGEANPLDWNYKSGKTWGYMAGGAAIGAFSGAVGATLATAGGAGAATMGIAMGSFYNSTLMSTMTNGKTDVSISFGAASYNMTDNEWGYLGKEGNSAMENVGYGLGALANMSDLVNGIDAITHWEDKMRAEYQKGAGEAVCYDDETIGNNIGIGTKGNRPSYPGPNNPRGLNAVGKKVDYFGPVRNASFLEYPGYIHDVAYARLGINGAQGLFTSVRALGVDARFVGQSMYLGLKHLAISPAKALQSMTVGTLLGAAALPKALAIPAIAYGFYETNKRYQVNVR